MLVKLGAKKENIWLCDSKGLITKNRSEIKNDKSAKLDKAFENMMAARNAELANTVTNMRR